MAFQPKTAMSQNENSEPKMICTKEEKFDEIFGKLRALARKHITEIAKTPEGIERLRVMHEAQGTIIPIMTKADMGFSNKNPRETD